MNGEKIKNIRLSKKLGLNETAKKAGISGSYLSNIEKGIKTNPSTETLEKIADALNVSINEFFDKDSIVKEKPIDKINRIIKDNGINTIAAHFEGEEFTEDDKEDIENFIKYVLSKKKNK